MRKKIKLYMLQEAKEFMRSLPDSVRDKMYFNIHRIIAGEVNRDLFKKLDGTDIWEFRTLYSKTAYRLFAFWDKDEEAMVIATHGITKKTQRTPSKEISKAEQIRRDYFNNKKN